MYIYVLKISLDIIIVIFNALTVSHTVIWKNYRYKFIITNSATHTVILCVIKIVIQINYKYLYIKQWVHLYILPDFL